MDNAEIRQIICEKCIVVRGFNNEIQFHQIQKSFPESRRINLATRTATLPSRDKEWIIQLQSVTDAQKYIEDVRIIKCPEGLLDISDCKLPCDIPDEWLQDEVISEQTSSSETVQEENDVKSDGEEDIDEETMEDEPAQTTTNMLKVTKLPSDTTEDGLRFFFENTRKFGGGDVDEVNYDEDTKTAIITFEEEDDVEAYIVGSESTTDIPEEEPDDSSHTGEQVPICSIEVSGMKENTTQDTIMYYLESKKGANADVETIEFVEDKNMYIVKFENEEAVETVLPKSHIVDGAKLQVKRHVPLKRYPNKALIKGFSPSTTKDGIMNFLEAKTKFEVEEVDFGEDDSGKAIVTFCEPIDIGDTQTACKKRALDGNYLTVHPVFVTNCIVVRGFSEKTNERLLEYYFDNKRKSGVEGVADVKMNKDEDYCVIYFENAEDALLACKRSHTIDNCKLKVQVFYDCLGVPADTEGPKFTLVITDINKYKVYFLKQSTTKRGAIEKQLHDIYAQITWPSSTLDSKITIDCTLTKEMKDYRKLAMSWVKRVKKNISSYVDALVTKRHSILQVAWGSVMEKLREINISDPDGVTLSVEKTPDSEIIIAGYTVPVTELSDKIKQVIQEVYEDLDCKEQLVQGDAKLKYHQLLILVNTHFKDKVKQKFEEMDIKIDTKKLVITFNGLSRNISSAKVMMFETINDMTSASIGTKSPAYIQFLQKQEVKKYVGKKIKDKGLIGVWDIQGYTIKMYSMSDVDAVAASTILKDCVVETHVFIHNLQEDAMHTPKWAQYTQAIHDEYERKSIITEIVEDEQGQIILYCTSKGEAGIIKQKIQGYFYRRLYSATGGQEVIVMNRDITGLDVDVIVNAATKDLAHSDGLGKDLVQKGGKSIQDECDQFTSYNGQLTEGECYCSKPGMLNCKMIVHANGPVWQGGSNNEEGSLQQCVETALVETEKNKHTSIAIPALCTGIFGYPPHLATRAIAQAVNDYFKRNKSSIVQTVYVCDVIESYLDLFVEAGDKIFDHAKDGKQKYGGKQSVPIYERLKDETDVTMLQTLLARGHYRSYHNRVYLGGPCNVGKSSLASILIGENAPLDWISTDSLVIYFGRNGIDLETKTMIPIRKDSFGHDVLSRVLRGEPNLDTPEFLSKKETVELISNIQAPCTEAANQNENNSFIKQEKGHPSDASIIPSDSNVSIHEVEDDPKHKKQMKTGILDDSSISALAQTPFSISNDLKRELKRGQYEMKIAPSDLVDFGGQKSFDMTHQLFIQQRGEFLLLFDCRKSLTDRLEEYRYRDITTADIFRHWVDSILIYCPDDNEVTPTILFVATHSDSFSQDEVVRRKAIAVESLSEMFQNHHMKSRIIYDDVFFIDATEKTDPEIERLKTKIVDIATRQSSWGKPMPISWVPLEMQLDKMKSLNISIIEKSEIVKLNSSNDDLALDERELEYFLKMQHSLGKMLYFGQHGLGKFIVVQPTSLVEILRAFITDEIFWPQNGQLSSILQNLNNTGKLLKKDLLKLWAQPVFSRIMPTDECKEFMIAVLLHLDILIEPKGYKGPRTLLAEYFLVPCIVQKKTAKGVLSYPNINERAICLSYQMKSSVPSAISYKLLGAAVHVWPLKIINDNLCLYNKAANFCIDKNNELYISVEEKRVVAILINCQSRKDIPSGIAASIQECLTLALTKVIQFYQNNFGSFHMNPDGSSLFEMSVGVICGKQLCFIPVVEVSKKKSWICRWDTKHNTDDLQVWEFKDYQGCPPSCTGPSENDLNMCPTDKHLIRLAAVLGINCFDTYYVHLEMDRKDWEEIEYQYRGNDPVSMKFMALIEWRRRRKNDVKVQNLLDALKAVEERQHVLCKICRDIDNVNDDTIATEGESVQYPRLQQVPGDSVLEELSQQIGNCVIQLGIELGLDSNTIDETMYRMYKDLFGQTFDILKKWKERNGKEATYDALLSALEHVGGRGIPFVKCQVGVEVKK